MERPTEYLEKVRRYPSILDWTGKSAVGPNIQPDFRFGDNIGSGIDADTVEKKPYMYHTWVYACAWAIAKNISRLPLVLKDKRNANETVEDKWGILELLNRPNQLMTRTTFMQILILNLLLPNQKTRREGVEGGQCFLMPRVASKENEGRVNLLRGDIPDVFMPFNDDFWSPLLEGKGFQKLVGWRFEIKGGKNAVKVDFATTELIRIYQANPYNWLEGLSNYQPCQIAVLQDIRADIFNSRLFDNNAIPAGVLSSDEWLDDPQRKEMMKSWYNTYGGTANPNKVAILSKGLAYKHIGFTQADMQWKDQKDNAFEKIVASFGLNKIALGKYEDINFATIKEGRKILWQDTYLPYSELVTEAINAQWIQYIDPNIELAFDVSDVEALQISYKEKTASASTMVEKMGFTPVLASRIAKIPLTEQDVKDYPWLDEKPPKYSATVTPATETEEDDKSLKRILYNKNKPQQIGLYIIKSFASLEKKFQLKMERFFNGQRNRFLELVDLWLKEQLKTAKTVKDLDTNLNLFVLSDVEENERLTKVFRPMVKGLLEQTEKQLEKELGGLTVWNVTDATLDKYTADRKLEIQAINNTTFRRAGEAIGEVLEEAIAENFTPQQTASAIKGVIKDVVNGRRNQAKTIARTETGIVVNTARYDAFEAEGIEYHQWVNAGDGDVRDAHQVGTKGGIEVSVVRVGQVFSNELGDLLYPLDPSGSLANIINCRCVAVAAKAPE